MEYNVIISIPIAGSEKSYEKTTRQIHICDFVLNGKDIY